MGISSCSSLGWPAGWPHLYLGRAGARIPDDIMHDLRECMPRDATLWIGLQLLCNPATLQSVSLGGTGVARGPTGVGTCESFFSFESNLWIESAIYHASRNTAQRTAGVPCSLLHLQRIFNPSVFCICDEREWCTDYEIPNWVLVYFNSVIKRVKQCCCTLILLSKSTLNANLTTNNRFFTTDDWQRGRFENFESDHQYESNLESDVRFEIESNHEASQVPYLERSNSWPQYT